MNDVAIRVENPGKLYRIGPRERYKVLRDTVTDAVPAGVMNKIVADRRFEGSVDFAEVGSLPDLLVKHSPTIWQYTKPFDVLTHGSSLAGRMRTPASVATMN